MKKQKASQVLKTEPITMAELLAKSKHKVRSFSSGQKVTARVVGKTNRALILDIGGKSEGMVAEKAFIESRDFIRNLKVGDEVTATVIVGESKDGTTLLSLRHAAQDSSWGKLEKARTDKTPVAVVGRAVNPSGITVEVEGLLGFIPTSQLGKTSAKNPQELVEKHFKAIPLEVDKSGNKIVLSEKEITDAGDIKLIDEALKKVKPGEVYDGVVTTVANFGCFVKINIGSPAGRAGKVSVEGLVHISELSWTKVESVADSVAVGDRVKVKIIGSRDGKIALSIKQALKDPWTSASEKYKKEDKVRGKVVRISDYGAFVELMPGIEGLIHVTKIPPATNLTSGTEVNCVVEEVDAKARKISLGLVLTSKPVGYK